jgi:hypothetical protein
MELVCWLYCLSVCLFVYLFVHLLVTLSIICPPAFQSGCNVITKQVPNAVFTKGLCVISLLYESNERHIMILEKLTESFLNLNTDIRMYYSLNRTNLYFHTWHIHGRIWLVATPSCIEGGIGHYNVTEQMGSYYIVCPVCLDTQHVDRDDPNVCRHKI